MFKRLSEIYGDQSFDIQQKAKTLLATVLAVTGITVLSGILRFFMGEYTMAVLNLSIDAVLWFSVYLLFRRRITTASSIAIVIGSLGLIGLGLQQVSGSPLSLYTISFYMVAAVTSTVLFGVSFYQYLAGTLITAVTYLYVLFGRVIPEAADTGEGLSTHIIGSSAIAIVITVMVYFIARNGLRVGQVLTKNAESINEQLSQQGRLLNRTREGLSIGTELQTEAEESLNLTSLIKDNLSQMLEGISTLNRQIQLTSDAHDRVIEANSEVRRSMNEQTSAVTESSASIEQIAANIRAISHSADEKRHTIANMEVAFSGGSRSLDETQIAFEAITRTTDDVLKVISVIEDISSRTNLLAMNAAIQAAHAGDAGRGFAVVAGEIRNLSEETAVNSKMVREIIEKNLVSMDHARQSMAGSVGVIRDFSHTIAEVNHAMDEIIRGTEELSTGTNELTQATTLLKDGHDLVHRALGTMENTVVSTEENISSIVDSSALVDQGIVAISRLVEEIQGKSRIVSEIGHTNLDQMKRLQQEMDQSSLSA